MALPVTISGTQILNGAQTPYCPPIMFGIDDSYSEANYSAAVNLYSGVPGAGQSFTGNGGIVTLVRFYLSKTGSPTGNIVAKIYAHTGTFGSTSIPTGSALATSDSIDVTTLTGLLSLISFRFTGTNKITLANGTKYVVTVEYSGGDVSNRVLVGTDDSSPTHAGNRSVKTGSWGADSTRDLIFYVYTIGGTGASAFYGVLLDTTSQELHAHKATDPTSSFSVTDDSNNPAEAGIETYSYVQSGDVIHIISIEFTNTRARYHTFNMATDVWVTTDDAIDTATEDLSASYCSCSIAVRSSDIVVGYSDVSEKLHGTNYHRLAYATGTAGSWGSPTALDDGGQVSYTGIRCVLGASDKVHFFYYDGTHIQHKSLTSADSLSSAEACDDNTPASVIHNPIHPVYYDSSGTERITVGWKQDSPFSRVYASEIDNDGTPGAEEQASGTVSIESGGGSTVACLAIDGTEVFLLLSDDINQEVYSTSNDDSAGWSSAQNEWFGVSIDAISSNVYDRSGTKLAFFVEDGSTVKYNEIDIAGAVIHEGAITSPATFAIALDPSLVLTGVSTDNATLSVSLIASRILIGSLTSDATLSASATGSKALMGSLTCNATVSTSTQAVKVVNGFITSNAALSVALAESVIRADSLTSDATVSASLSASPIRNASFTSDATLSASATGSLGTVIHEGSLTSDATVSASLIGSVTHTGILTSDATLSANLTGSAVAELNGSITSDAAVSATLNAKVTFGGRLTGNATVSTSLSASAIREDSITSDATLNASLSTSVIRNGKLTSNATLSASLVASPERDGKITSNATLSASLVASPERDGKITSNATLSISLTPQPLRNGSLTSNATLSASLTGTGAGALEGSLTSDATLNTSLIPSAIHNAAFTSNATISVSLTSSVIHNASIQSDATLSNSLVASPQRIGVITSDATLSISLTPTIERYGAITSNATLSADAIASGEHDAKFTSNATLSALLIPSAIGQALGSITSDATVFTSLQTTVIRAGSVTDNATLSASLQATIERYGSFTGNALFSASLSASPVRSGNITSNATISAASSANATREGVITCNATLSVSCQASGGMLLIEIGESVSVTDTVGLVYKEIAITETVTVTDAAAHVVAIREIISVLDSIGITVTVHVDETISVQDTVALTVILSIPETVTVDDSITKIHALFENITIAELVTLMKDLPVGGESIAVQDSVKVIKLGNVDTSIIDDADRHIIVNPRKQYIVAPEKR